LISRRSSAGRRTDAPREEPCRRSAAGGPTAVRPARLAAQNAGKKLILLKIYDFTQARCGSLPGRLTLIRCMTKPDGFGRIADKSAATTR
jgi:hypothetical protein